MAVRLERGIRRALSRRALPRWAGGLAIGIGAIVAVATVEGGLSDGGLGLVEAAIPAVLHHFGAPLDAALAGAAPADRVPRARPSRYFGCGRPLAGRAHVGP